MSDQLTPDPARYMRPADYAKRCGVSHQAISNRILRGVLPVVKQPLLDGSVLEFVDAEAYPPARLEPGAPKNKKK